MQRRESRSKEQRRESWQIVAETEVERWLLADRGRDRGGRSRPRPRWARMEETETEVGSKEQTETEAEQIVAEMVTGGADRG